MPIPSPGKKEPQKDFIGRCMGHLADKKEFTQDQRAAVCFSQWKKAKAAEAAAETLTGRCSHCGMKMAECTCPDMAPTDTATPPDNQEDSGSDIQLPPL